jgi:hypothetical protein
MPVGRIREAAHLLSAAETVGLDVSVNWKLISVNPHDL